MNKTLWTSSIAFLVLGLCSICSADSNAPPSLGSARNDSYSAAALYNLGNSFARQGEPALAVVNYERARILAPLDSDVRANLRQLRASAGLAPGPSSFSDNLQWVSPNAAYWIGIVGLLLSGAAWLLLSFRSVYRLSSRIALGAGLVLMAFAVGDTLAIGQIMHRYVVLQPAVASASPASGVEPLFTVPPATVVQQQDDHAGFSLIRDSQGRVGWVPRNHLMPIIPTIDSQGDVHAKT